MTATQNEAGNKDIKISIDEIFSTYDNFMSVYKGKGGTAREAMHIMAHVMCAAQDESLKKGCQVEFKFLAHRISYHKKVRVYLNIH